MADSYNRRDQKRIDKLVARCEARAVKYGIATYKPPTPADAPSKSDADAIAAATDMLKGVLDAVKADTAPQKDDADALRKEAQALYDRGAITEAALQLAQDVADGDDVDCIRRCWENLQGASRRADNVPSA